MKMHKIYRILPCFLLPIAAMLVIFHSTCLSYKRPSHALEVISSTQTATSGQSNTHSRANTEEGIDITKLHSNNRSESYSNLTKNISETLFDVFKLSNLTMLKEMESPREEFKFLMTPMKLSWKVPDLLRDKHLTWSMLVMIKSDFKRVKERNAIRESWGAIRYFNGIRLEVVFAIARADSEARQIELWKENVKFGDLLQVDQEETYRDIGLKALASMQWIGKHFPEDWLYFSADDDILPDFNTLTNDIHKLMENKPRDLVKEMPIVCAYSYESANVPERGDTTWTIGWDIYPHKLYPPFCLGGFYGMTVKLAFAIYEQSRKYPYYRMDDVFITGFMRLKACDTFASGDFLFDKSDKNCAISTKINSNFKHIGSNPQVYLNKWRLEESRLRQVNTEIIKS